MKQQEKTIEDSVYQFCELCILYRGLCYLLCPNIDED